MTRSACACQDLPPSGANRPSAEPVRPAPQADERSTAFHEAAHAVFAVLAGSVVFSATIEPDASSRGRVRWWRQAAAYGSLEREVLVFLAGPQAESLVDQGIDPTITKLRFAVDDAIMPGIERMQKERPFVSSKDDEGQALHRLLYRREHSSPASLRMDFIRAGGTALRILQHPDVWRAVTDVAEKLLLLRTIGDAEIRGAMPPELTDARLLALARGDAMRLMPSLLHPPPTYPPLPTAAETIAATNGLPP